MEGDVEYVCEVAQMVWDLDLSECTPLDAVEAFAKKVRSDPPSKQDHILAVNRALTAASRIMDSINAIQFQILAGQSGVN